MRKLCLGLGYWKRLMAANDTKQFFKRLITPSQMVTSIEDVDLELLYREGFRSLFLDVDNTLMTYEQRTVSLERDRWVSFAKSIGFDVFLVSNNSSHRRIERVAKQLGVRGIYFAMKPLTYGVRELVKDYKIDLKTSVFIGDKILTDVVIGNWLRAHTILVEPMNKRLSLLRTIQRDLELLIINSLK